MVNRRGRSVATMDEHETTPATARANRHLRVGTTQRENALEVLRNAAAEDRISFEELEARVPRALGAMTRGDLQDVLDDLVPVEDLDRMVADDLVGLGRGYSWDDPVVLMNTSWRALIVEGPWEAPPFLEVQTGVGGARLDFSQATARTKIIDLVVMTSWGQITIIVPPGWGVDPTTLQSVSNQTEQKSVPTRPRKGMPRIVLRGRAGGTVKVRLTTDRDLANVARRLRAGKRVLPPEISSAPQPLPELLP